MRESLQNAVTDDDRRQTTTDAAGHFLCSHWTDGPWLQKNCTVWDITIAQRNKSPP